MKNYEVTLMATSYKTVTLPAESEKEAEKLAGYLYFSTDMLDFDADDIDEVSIEACEIEDKNERLQELISDLQIAINEAHLSVDDVKRAMDAVLECVGAEQTALS